MRETIDGLSVNKNTLINHNRILFLSFLWWCKEILIYSIRGMGVGPREPIRWEFIGTTIISIYRFKFQLVECLGMRSYSILMSFHYATELVRLSQILSFRRRHFENAVENRVSTYSITFNHAAIYISYRRLCRRRQGQPSTQNMKDLMCGRV